VVYFGIISTFREAKSVRTSSTIQVGRWICWPPSHFPLTHTTAWLILNKSLLSFWWFLCIAFLDILLAVKYLIHKSIFPFIKVYIGVVCHIILCKLVSLCLALNRRHYAIRLYHPNMSNCMTLSLNMSFFV